VPVSTFSVSSDGELMLRVGWMQDAETGDIGWFQLAPVRYCPFCGRAVRPPPGGVGEPEDERNFGLLLDRGRAPH
jgi:hypothetical protein